MEFRLAVFLDFPGKMQVGFFPRRNFVGTKLAHIIRQIRLGKGETYDLLKR